MNPNRDLIKKMIQSGIRANQSFSTHKFLISESTNSEAEVETIVDVLLKKLNKETLVRHANLNGKIIDSK